FVGLDDTLDFDAIYWESTATINESDNEPNVDTAGTSAKFPAYNSVVGSTMRLEFVEPTEHNVHYYDMGTCSDGLSLTKSACVALGVCEDSQWTTEADCIAQGSCDETSHTNQSDCESNGTCSDTSLVTEQECVDAGADWRPHTWTPLAWQAEEWSDGLTALELFSGPEIMLQGDVLGYSGGCRDGLLTQDFSGDMQFVYQNQFFGINGYKQASSGSTARNRINKIRFGYGSDTEQHTDSGWYPQIGIGIYIRTYRYLQYDDTEEYSTAWLDPIDTNGCGTYGNGLGAAAEDAASNLWIR
ncbi:MAG: hypothetical protein VX278_10810, partial [Myxococcota bacterium]|nr:hypothetical protein [Myxococcota bacterium]